MRSTSGEEKYKKELLKNNTYSLEQRNDLSLWQFVDYSGVPIQQLINKK